MTNLNMASFQEHVKTDVIANSRTLLGNYVNEESVSRLVHVTVIAIYMKKAGVAYVFITQKKCL